MANVTSRAKHGRSNGRTRVAWITFDFPPRQSSGVFRAIKLYKYLDKNKFEVDFITHGHSRRFRGAVHDESLLAEVHPAPTVYRVRTIILHDVLSALGGRLRRHRALVRPEGKPAAAAPAETSQRQQPSPRGGRGVRQAIYKWFALSTYIPDYLFLWGWSAAARTLWLHLRDRYDLVYTTSHPESAHLGGLVLNALGVKWVVDYRYGGPLWIKDVVGYRKPPLRERLDHWYQRRVLTRANWVITQSQRIRTDFCAEFGLDPTRVVVIPSGYDEEDFERAQRPTVPFVKESSEVHILHMGALEGVAERERTEILEALDTIGAALRARGRTLVFHALGSNLVHDAKDRLTHVDYRYHGVVVHRDIPAYLLAADCYLLSTWTTSNGNVQGFIPSKLWEYLRAGAPILTTGPKDEVWSIVNDAGVGIHLPLHQERAAIDRLADELLDRIAARGELAPSVGEYSWRRRAASVQVVFQRVVHETGALS